MLDSLYSRLPSGGCPIKTEIVFHRRRFASVRFLCAYAFNGTAFLLLLTPRTNCLSIRLRFNIAEGLIASHFNEYVCVCVMCIVLGTVRMRIICSSVSRSVRRIGYIGLPAFVEILSHTHTDAFVHSSHIGRANYVLCVSNIQCVLRIATVRLYGCESIWRIKKEEIHVHVCVLNHSRCGCDAFRRVPIKTKTADTRETE